MIDGRLDPALQRRLELLRDTNVIAASTAARTAPLIQLASDLLGFALTEDNGAFLATHLAMAIERVARGEGLPLLDLPLDELNGRETAWRVADALIDELTAQGIRLPAHERPMIAMHVAAVETAAGSNGATI